jgi:autoinducer 2-degrading protein
MIVRVINVAVKEAAVDGFIEASKRNHEGSIREPGVLRFDVLQSSSDPTRFVLYEAYRSNEATALHKETEHYAVWKKAVDPMMAKSRESTAFEVIAPASTEGW